MSKEKLLKDFVRGGGAIFLAMTVGYILSFFSKILLGRYLGPGGFGLYEMSMTILGILLTAAALGFSAGIERFIPLYKSRGENDYVAGYVHAVTVSQLVASLVCGVGLVILAPWLTSFFSFSPVFTDMLYVLALVLPFRVFSKSFSNIFFAYKHSLIGKGVKQVVESAVFLFGAGIIWFFDLSVYYVVVVLLASWGTTCLTYVVLYHMQLPRLPQERSYELKRWFSFSAPLVLSSILGFVLQWTDNFVIGRYLTEDALGVYGAAYSMAFYLFIAPNMFSAILLPILTEAYENNKERFKSVFTTIRSWSFAFALFVGMVFIVFSEEILTLLFGSDYGSGAGALSVLSAFFIVATYYFFSGKLLNINEDTNFVFYSNIGMAIGNLVLSVFLVQWLGVLGAGIASGFSYFLVRFISHMRSKRFIDIPADRWFEGSLILITGGSMAMAYYLARGVTALLDIPLVVYLVLAGCLYTGLFLLGVHLFDLAGEEEKAILSVFEEELGIDLSWLKQLL